MKKGWLLMLVFMALGLLILWMGQDRHTVTLSFRDMEPVPRYHWQNRQEVFRVAVLNVLNREDILENQRAIIKMLGKSLDKNGILVYCSSYHEMMQLLKGGKVDMAIASTGSYLLHGDSARVEVLAMQQRSGSSLYNGLIIVPKDSPAQSLADLEGRYMLYSDPYSYAGYLSVLQSIRELGKQPRAYFGKTAFSYNNDLSIREVAEGKVDAAAVDRWCYDFLAKNDPEIIAHIRVLTELPFAGTGPVLIRSDYEEKERVQRAVLALHQNPIAAKALQTLLIERFVLPDLTFYPAVHFKEDEEELI